MKCCALNTSPTTLYLDHISPLSAMLEIPLIVSHEESALLTQRYYPGVSVRYVPDLEFRLKDLVEEFDGLIECDFWTPQHQFLFQSLYQKEMRLIYCPHGQSDKGYQAPSLAPYALQQAVLFYGELMKQMLQELHISIPPHAVVGNFRSLYYQKYRTALQAIVEKEIFASLKKTNRTLFYAPTWNDADRSSSFYLIVDQLLKELPPDWNLIVKIHPLLIQKDPAFLARYEYRSHSCVFVHQYPLIYPILDRIDAYLGDASSVGYDVLAFQKPMFFLRLPHLLPGRLQACGSMIDLQDSIFAKIEKGLASLKTKASNDLYQLAFQPSICPKTAVESLLKELK